MFTNVKIPNHQSAAINSSQDKVLIQFYQQRKKRTKSSSKRHSLLEKNTSYFSNSNYNINYASVNSQNTHMTENTQGNQLIQNENEINGKNYRKQETSKIQKQPRTPPIKLLGNPRMSYEEHSTPSDILTRKQIRQRSISATSNQILKKYKGIPIGQSAIQQRGASSNYFHHTGKQDKPSNTKLQIDEEKIKSKYGVFNTVPVSPTQNNVLLNKNTCIKTPSQQNKKANSSNKPTMVNKQNHNQCIISYQSSHKNSEKKSHKGTTLGANLPTSISTTISPTTSTRLNNSMQIPQILQKNMKKKPTTSPIPYAQFQTQDYSKYVCNSHNPRQKSLQELENSFRVLTGQMPNLRECDKYYQFYQKEIEKQIQQLQKSKGQDKEVKNETENNKRKINGNIKEKLKNYVNGGHDNSSISAQISQKAKQMQKKFQERQKSQKADEQNQQTFYKQCLYEKQKNQSLLQAEFQQINVNDNIKIVNKVRNNSSNKKKANKNTSKDQRYERNEEINQSKNVDCKESRKIVDNTVKQLINIKQYLNNNGSFCPIETQKAEPQAYKRDKNSAGTISIKSKPIPFTRQIQAQSFKSQSQNQPEPEQEEPLILLVGDDKDDRVLQDGLQSQKIQVDNVKIDENEEYSLYVQQDDAKCNNQQPQREQKAYYKVRMRQQADYDNKIINNYLSRHPNNSNMNPGAKNIDKIKAPHHEKQKQQPSYQYHKEEQYRNQYKHYQHQPSEDDDMMQSPNFKMYIDDDRDKRQYHANNNESEDSISYKKGSKNQMTVNRQIFTQHKLKNKQQLLPLQSHQISIVSYSSTQAHNQQSKLQKKYQNSLRNSQASSASRGSKASKPGKVSTKQNRKDQTQNKSKGALQQVEKQINDVMKSLDNISNSRHTRKPSQTSTNPDIHKPCKQQVEALKQKISQLQKMNKKNLKFIESVYMMRRTLEKIPPSKTSAKNGALTQDCSLKELWRWVKELPSRAI